VIIANSLGLGVLRDRKQTAGGFFDQYHTLLYSNKKYVEECRKSNVNASIVVCCSPVHDQNATLY